MLINKGSSAGSIACFKMVNGDEVVAKVVEVDGADFVVTRPCTIIPDQNGIGLMQSLICGDMLNNNVRLKGQHIMMHAPVVDDIEKHYIKTTTGIQLR